MKVARVNGQTYAALQSAFGIGSTATMPNLVDLTDVDGTTLADGDVLIWDAGTLTWVPGPIPTPTPVSMFVPVMVEDVSTGLWYVTVTGDGDAVMTEVSL